MKIIYLLPPSEGKNTWWNIWVEKLSFPFEKPVEIAINATQKDLKCTWVRYEQGIELNKKLFFAQLPHPNPLLWEEREQAAWNYKLPIETKWLYKFWWNSITQALDNIKSDYIVDMLPGAYAKMIDWKTLKTPRVQVNFLHQKDGELKKITHGVKKVKWEYVKNLCEKWVSSLEKLEWEKVQISENEYHIQVISK